MAATLSGVVRQDRRMAARFAPRTLDIPARARLRPGAEVTIVNLSWAGVLIDGPCRLQPGAPAGISLDLTGVRGVLACRVVRCHVSHVGGPGGIRYRAGLAFDEPLAFTPGPRAGE